MDKKLILNMLRNQTLHQLDEAEKAYAKTAEYTKSDDLKAESKYDTRGVEAGMLAGAQRKRVEELKQDLELLDAIPINDESKTEIMLGSMVEMEINKNRRKYFVSSCAGGTLLQVNGEPVLVISVFSPMGVEMVGLSVQDTFILETNSGEREHLILSIW
jgi:transcription elongation GreA/GreB family factor